MQRILHATALLVAVLSFGGAASAREYECEKPQNWSLSDGQLTKILADHREWLKLPKLSPDLSDERRAHLCNADLSGSILEKANREPNPEGTIELTGAELNGANLATAELDGARLVDAELKGAYLVGARLNGANLDGAKLNGANLQYAKLNCLDPGAEEEKCASLSGAELNGAYLGGAELNGASLLNARLNCLDPGAEEEKCASLSGAKLNDANLATAELKGALLVETELKGAYLVGARLNGANLEATELKGANLTGIDFRNAQLVRTNLTDAWFDGANVGGARYEPVSAPNPDHLTNISGITEVTFGKGKSSGLLKLRAALREAGLRGAEQEATYAIRRNERLMLEVEEKNEWIKFGVIESRFELLFFEYTTEWGRSPGQALYIMFAVLAFMTPVYAVAIVRGTIHRTESGIFKIEPKGRMLFLEGSPSLLEEDRIKRVDGALSAAIIFGFYFSLMSAFQMGWRDLNVGAWLSRMQMSRFSFRARGWTRLVSGIQSLVSVYLLAIWALTYFGRPFQ